MPSNFPFSRIADYYRAWLVSAEKADLPAGFRRYNRRLRRNRQRGKQSVNFAALFPAARL